MAKTTTPKKSPGGPLANSLEGFDLTRDREVQKLAQRLDWFERYQVALHALGTVLFPVFGAVGLYLANTLTSTATSPPARRLDGLAVFALFGMVPAWLFTGLFVHMLLNGMRRGLDRLESEHWRLLDFPDEPTRVARHPNGALIGPRQRPSRSLDSFDFARPRAIQRLEHTDALLTRFGTALRLLSGVALVVGTYLLVMKTPEPLSPVQGRLLAFLLFVAAGWFSLLAPVWFAAYRGRIWTRMADLKEEHYRLITGQPQRKDRRRNRDRD